MSHGSLGHGGGHHHHGPPGWMVGGGYPGWGYPAWQAPQIIMVYEETAAEKRARLKKEHAAGKIFGGKRGGVFDLSGLGGDGRDFMKPSRRRYFAAHGFEDVLGPNTAPVLFGVALVAFLMLKRK